MKNGFELIFGPENEMTSQNINSTNISMGKNVYIHPTATIRGLNGPAKSIHIGDNTYIGEHVQIICDEFYIGDYCKIHHHSNIHGYKPCKIGHNAWIGQYTIIDCIGGTHIGNNCGIGAHSQLWSHIRYGDPLEGCNYMDEKQLIVGNDVWFVGHCIISPITAHNKSMALVGSVITKDMEENNIYGGSPAVNLTNKIKPQFSPISIEEKRKLLEQFNLPKNIRLVEDDSEIINDEEVSYFNINSRKYTKKSTEEEVKFMKALQSKLIKFVPFE